MDIARKAASNGKYAPLFRNLSVRTGTRWRATFAQIEAVLGFKLPDSARIHRPWWANQKRGGGHSHALAWQAAGWKTTRVDLAAETLVFEREDGAHVTDMFVSLCREVPLAGKQVHDANIVATMLAHGERRLLTFNASDFRRYGERIELIVPDPT